MEEGVVDSIRIQHIPQKQIQLINGATTVTNSYKESNSNTSKAPTRNTATQTSITLSEMTRAPPSLSNTSNSISSNNSKLSSRPRSQVPGPKLLALNKTSRPSNITNSNTIIITPNNNITQTRGVDIIIRVTLSLMGGRRITIMVVVDIMEIITGMMIRVSLIIIRMEEVLTIKATKLTSPETKVAINSIPNTTTMAIRKTTDREANSGTTITTVIVDRISMAILIPTVINSIIQAGIIIIMELVMVEATSNKLVQRMEGLLSRISSKVVTIARSY